jgi:Ca-activated chloride channel family protein
MKTLATTAFALWMAPSFALVDVRTDEGYTLKSDVRLVLLDVSVKDGSGSIVRGLPKDNFSVYENGHEQQIKVFTNRDMPVTVGVLVDNSFSMTPKRNEVLKAAGLFLKESNPQDEVFVLNFNDKVKAGLPPSIQFSSDIDQLRQALSRGKPIGKTALNDAVVAGLKQLQNGHRDRRTLVVISDGGDNASEHTRAELMKFVEESMATVYTIGIYEQGDPDRDPALLKRLARVSGGDAYFPNTPAEMSDICERIAKDIRERYVVGYTASGGEKAELRKIRIKVKSLENNNLSATSRTSYRYETQK